MREITYEFEVRRQIDHPSVAATLGIPVEATTALLALEYRLQAAANSQI